MRMACHRILSRYEPSKNLSFLHAQIERLLHTQIDTVARSFSWCGGRPRRNDVNESGLYLGGGGRMKRRAWRVEVEGYDEYYSVDSLSVHEGGFEEVPGRAAIS